MNVPAGEVAITTTIPADLLKRVDERAKQELISRAAYVRRLLAQDARRAA
jgi:metal-responsive CopG/Arc/MetJ family transcriptional regulator